MGSRCFIAHIAPDGAGRAIYCHLGSPPDRNGLMLLENYQDEDEVLALMDLGRISSLENTARRTADYVKDGPARPHTFSGGTDGFFGRFWTQGTEWLYAWTPDGWFAAPGHRRMPQELLFDDDADPRHARLWAVLDREAAETQRPRPLSTVIEEYLAQLQEENRCR